MRWHGRRLKCVEAPDEEPTVLKEPFLEIKCNISSTTNYMTSGITEVRQLVEGGPTIPT